MNGPNWPVPGTESSQGKTGDARDTSAQAQSSQRAAKDYVSNLLLYVMVFGVVGVVFSSWFPVALGACLFFTNEEFIEWILQKVGIRFVPDTLGPEFIKIFVFLVGWWALLAYWKDSVPAWMAPPAGFSLLVLAGATLVLAVVRIIAAAVVKRRLPPWLSIQIAADTHDSTVVGLSLLGAVALITSALIILNWPGGR